MKRLIMLAVLCAFVLSAAAASAADIKASGAWAIEAVWAENWNFKDKGAKDNAASVFDIHQRATTTFQFIANENLKGVLVTRYGTEQWGTNGFEIGQGDSATGGGNQITVRRAYVDFKWPDTSIGVKAGYQAVTFPNAFGGGSMIMDEEAASALVMGSITDNVDFLVGYVRAYANAASGNREVDVFAAALPMNFDGFSFAPFGAVAPLGSAVQAASVGQMSGLLSQNASDTGTNGRTLDDAYWLGAAFTMDLFDPFVVKADINYGNVSSNRKQNEKSGWFFDAALEYKGMDFMTPELFFVYSTGEDGNATTGSEGSERMPIIRAQSWAIGSFFFGGDTLLAGSFPGSNGGRPTYAGFWALGLSLKDIQSFAEGLTHQAHLIYAKGTNDKSIGDGYTTTANQGSKNNITYGRTLTEKDSLWEVDFNTAYKIYDELTMTFDLGYINLDADETTWGTDQGGGDAWKVATGVVYKF